MKFLDVLESWYKVYERKVSYATKARTRGNIDTHIIPYFNGAEIEALTQADIQGFVDYVSQHGSPLRHPGALSYATVKKLYLTVQSVLRFAVEEGYRTDNPSKGVILPRKVYKEIEIFTSEEVEKLIASARPKWLGDMIAIAYRTGMRRGEIFGLQKGDVYLDRGYLIVRHSINATKPNERLINPPKSRRSRRKIKIDNETVRILRKRIDSSPLDWLFVSKIEKPLSPWYVTKYMRQATQKAEIRHRSFHVLRHTHASMLLMAGVNPKIVQERLGHATISMTMDVYGHLFPDMQDQAVDVFNGI